MEAPNYRVVSIGIYLCWFEGRPWPIMLQFLPILLFFYSPMFCLFFFSIFLLNVPSFLKKCVFMTVQNNDYKPFV